MANTTIPIELSSTPGIVDNSNATAITIDSSENVGIGVTPSSWSSSIYKGLQIGTGIGVGGIIGRVDGTNSINLGLNWYYGGGATNTYIDSAAATNYSQEAGTHRWFHAASGTAGGALTFSESMRIDASGKVGIGTTSPSVKVDSHDNGVGLRATRLSNTDQYIEMQGGDGAGLSHINANYQMAFKTGNTERMRINSTGGVSINTTDSDGLFTIKSAGNAVPIYTTTSGINYFFYGSTEGGGKLWSMRTAGTGNFGSANGDWIFVNDTGSTQMRLDYSAATVVGDFVDTSDVGLKENIVDTTDGLTKIMQLQPRKFDWKEKGKQQQVNGFIAQELETILPNEVSGDDYDEENPDHGHKAINTSGVLAVAVKAIQEQQTIIESLEARITALES